MFNLVPVNMFEVQQKLEWSLSQNIKADETSIIKDALKENVQNMVNDVLEGPYWMVKWNDEQLKIYDINGTFVDQVQPINDNLISDFKSNAPVLLRNLFQQVQKIISNN